MRTKLLWCWLAVAVCGATAGASEPAAPLPPREKFHLFLLVGQSNMAGRGTLEKQDTTPHPRVLMLNKAGEWAPAVDPLHFDKPSAGVGLSGHAIDQRGAGAFNGERSADAVLESSDAV